MAVDEAGGERAAAPVDGSGGAGGARGPDVRPDPGDAVALEQHPLAAADPQSVEEGDVGDVGVPRHQLTHGGTTSVPSSARTSFVPASIVTTIVAPSSPASR